MAYKKTLGTPDPRETPPVCCEQCGLLVKQVFLAQAPANALSYICDADPVPFMEGVGSDIVVDIYGKVRRGRILIAAAKSTEDEVFYNLHTQTCITEQRKTRKEKGGELPSLVKDVNLWEE